MQRQDGCGLILNIGSVSALRPAPGTAAYAAAKAGLVALTQALAIEWAPAVRVNCVTAGLVRTDDTAAHHGDEQALAAVAATVPLGRMATPDDIADACLLHTPSRVASACLITSASLYSAATSTPSKSRDAWRDQPGRLAEDMSREPVGRHEQILAVAAGLFARKGVAATTVRELADEVGILSGSLYHHFDSKEAMVDEILAPYLEDLREACESVLSSETDPRTRLCGLVVASLRVVEAHPHATEIYQSDVNYLSQFERFGYLAGAAQQVRKTWLGVISDGVARGVFRSDLDPGIAYRLMRDAIWLSVRWFRPTPDYPLTRFAQECTSLFLDGVAERRDEAALSRP